MKLKPIVHGLFCVAGLVATLGDALAQGYPNKPVKLLVGAVPGGAPDIIARMLGEKLAQSLGQPFIVENKPGAGGTVVPGQVAKSAPDGYTLLVADIGQLVIAPHMQADVKYDPVKDFTPIGLVAITPLFIVSNAKSSIKTLSDLISQAKANPGVINYGSSGIGSIHHIAMEVFKAGTGTNIVHVPFKGSGQSVPALVGGEVPIGVATLPTVGSFVQSGMVNLLAATSAQRFPDAPDVPAISEIIKGYDYASEIGFVAPAGTPRDVVMKLSAAIKTALDAPEIRAKFKVLGSVPAWTSPDDYAQNIRVNFRKYGEAVKSSGARAN
jgi:tripartite-type tricarboxylate transporter receptor subunit TctC